MTGFTRKLNNGVTLNDGVIPAVAPGAVNIETGKNAIYATIGDIIRSTGNFNDINIKSGKYSEININSIRPADAAGRVGNIKLTAELSSSIDAFVGTQNGAVGNINVDVATSANADLNIEMRVLATATATTAASATVGNITVNGNGAYADSDVFVEANGAKIGNISINAKGFDSTIEGGITALGVATTTANTLQGGSVGTVSLVASGVNSTASLSQVITSNNLSTLRGSDIGNLTLTASATDSDATISQVRSTNGNIGNFALAASAESTIADINLVSATIGNVGNITLNATGLFSQARVDQITATSTLLAGQVVGGNVGNIIANASAYGAETSTSVSSSGQFSAGGTYYNAGNIGDITSNVSGISGRTQIFAAAENGGNIGNITANLTGANATSFLAASAEFGNIKNVRVTSNAVNTFNDVNVSVGSAADNSATPVRRGGNIGDVTLDAGGGNLNAIISADTVNNAANIGSIGKVTLNAGLVNGYGSSLSSSITAGGNIGAVAASAKSTEGSLSANIGSYNGNIAGVSLTSSGVSSFSQAFVSARNGDVGALSAIASSANANASINARDTVNATNGAQFAGGVRNAGAVTVTASAQNSQAGIVARVDGQSINGQLVGARVGDIRLTASGNASNVSTQINVDGIMSTAPNATLTEANTGRIGNITSTVSGVNANTVVNINATDGVNIGNVNATVNALNGNQQIGVNTNSGNLGNITFTNTGANSFSNGQFSALDRGTVGGNIGNVTIGATGVFARNQTSVTAENAIGNLTINATGNRAEVEANISLNDNAQLGKTTINAAGTDSAVDFDVEGDNGSDMGDVAVNVRSGDNSTHQVEVQLLGTDSDISTIGNTTINVTNTASSAARLIYDVVRGNVGNVTGVLTGGFDGQLSIDASATRTASNTGGVIGNVSFSNASEVGYTQVELSAATSIGNINLNSTGAQSSFFIDLKGTATQIGDITVVVGTDMTGNTLPYNIGDISINTAAVVGEIKVSGGSNTSSISLLSNGGATNALSIEKVDFSGFNGVSVMDLSGVLAGTTILAAKTGSNIVATNFNDTITISSASVDQLTTGDGNDTITFGRIAAGNQRDIIGDFDTARDVLQFSKAGLTGFTGAVGAPLSANALVNSASNTPALTADSRFIFNTTSKVLSYDADGSGAGAAIDIVTLTGVTSLSVNDFLIIA